MKHSFLLFLLFTLHSHPILSSTQENVPFQRTDHLKTRQTNSSTSSPVTVLEDDFVMNVSTEVTSTASSHSMNDSTQSKAGDLKVFGIDVPDLPSFNTPLLGPLPCISTLSARPGTCNADASCGGTSVPDGPCALSLGTCCTNFISCGGFSLANVSVFASPGYPAPLQAGQACDITINKYLLAAQMRIDFIDLELAPSDPLTGLCSDDSLEILGLPGLKLPRICGKGSGQHLYIPMTLAVLQIRLKFTLSRKAFPRKFKIQVTQFEKNHWNSAPAGCFQYYSQPSGSITSLQFEKTPETKLSYSICFKKFNDVCGIKLIPGAPRLARSLVLPELVKSSVPEYGYSLMKSADVYSHMSSIEKPLLPEPKSHDHAPASYVPSKSYKSFPLVHESLDAKSYIAPLPLPLPIPSVDKLKAHKIDLIQDLIDKKMLILQSLLLDLHKLGAGEVIAKALGVKSLDLSPLYLKDKLPAKSYQLKTHAGYSAYPPPVKHRPHGYPAYAGSFKKAYGYRSPYGRAYGGKGLKYPLPPVYKVPKEEAILEKPLLTKPLFQLGMPMIPGYPLVKSPPVAVKPLITKPVYQLGMPMIPGFPLFKSPAIDLKPLLQPELKTLEIPAIKPIELPGLEPLLPVSPIASSLKPLNMTKSLLCAGKSSIIHSHGALCSDHLEEVTLTTAPFILFVDDRSDGKPFNFAFTYARQACSQTVL